MQGHVITNVDDSGQRSLIHKLQRASINFALPGISTQISATVVPNMLLLFRAALLSTISLFLIPDASAQFVPNSQCTAADLGTASDSTQTAGYGETRSCPSLSFVAGTCTSGSGLDCQDRSSHEIHCRQYSGVNDFVTGPETDWIHSFASIQAYRAWSHCEDDQVITSRCAGGSETDCRINNLNAHHGIRCRSLGPQVYLQPSVHWVCTSSGEPGFCPEGYLPVSSCGANQNPSCAWDGCSGTRSYNGLKCQQWAYLKDLVWDYSLTPEERIEVIEDVNPIIGSRAALDLEFETSASASFTSSLDFDVEFSGKIELEKNMLSLFGFPSLSGIFGGDDDFAELKFVTGVTGEVNFEAAAAAQLRSDLKVRTYSYVSNPLDSWSENFVRLVHYKRRQIKTIRGTAKCCNCERPESDVTVQFEMVQTGMLALHIKDYPDLNLEQISPAEFVGLYLDGTIVNYDKPSRFFQGAQDKWRSFWIFVKYLLSLLNPFTYL